MLKLILDLYKSVKKMINHDGIEYSGYMSFMMLVSIFPFFIFILAFTSFFGASELGEKFIEITSKNMPSHSVDLIRSRINELIISPPQGLLTLAVCGTIWTSSSFIECLRTILNRVYEIKSPPNYILRRLLSIVQFLVISTIFMVAMFLLLIIPIGLEKIPRFIDINNNYNVVIAAVRYNLIFFLLLLSVCLIYYIIPNVKLNFFEVIPGAVLTIVLWTCSGFLLSKYIVYYRQISIIYGSLGSIILTLMFFYIVNLIFIIGAEFNYLTKNKND